MYILKYLIILFDIVILTGAHIKFTNLKCVELDKPFATIPICKLKLVRRGVVSLEIYVKLHQVPVNNVSVSIIDSNNHFIIDFFLISATLSALKESQWLSTFSL